MVYDGRLGLYPCRPFHVGGDEMDATGSMASWWWCEAARAGWRSLLWLHGMNQVPHGRGGCNAGQGTAKATPPGTSISFLEMKCIPKEVTCLW